MNPSSIFGGASSNGMFTKLLEGVENGLRRFSLAFVHNPCGFAKVMAPYVYVF